MAYARWCHWRCGRTQLKAATINQSFNLTQPHSSSLNLIQPHSTSLNLIQPHSTSLNLIQPHSTLFNTIHFIFGHLFKNNNTKIWLSRFFHALGLLDHRTEPVNNFNNFPRNLTRYGKNYGTLSIQLINLFGQSTLLDIQNENKEIIRLVDGDINYVIGFHSW